MRSKNHPTMGFCVAIVCLVLPAFGAGADDIFAVLGRHDVAAVRAMLDADPALVRATTPEYNETPLHRAAQDGFAELVALLIERGADVNAVAYNGFTPLHLAGDPAVVRELIKGGADVSKKDNWGDTPLQRAAQGESVAAAQAMIDAGVTVDLISALSLNMRDRAKAIIASDPASVRAPQGGTDLCGNKTPLGIAAGNGDREMVELLLAAGAPVDSGTFLIRAGGTGTPLCNAVWAGHADIVQLLLERGATTHAAGGKFFDSIFDYAVQHSEPRIVELLLAHGVLKEEGEYGFAMRRSPLSTAADNGDVEKVRLLLRYGADYFNDEDKRRAMFVAGLGKHEDAVRLLSEAGAAGDVYFDVVMGNQEAVSRAIDADPTVLNGHDPLLRRSLLSWAIVAARPKLARWLVDRGADVSDRSPGPVSDEPLVEGTERPGFNGAGGYAQRTETPLLVALGVGDRGSGHVRDAELAHLLLAKGADPNVKGWMDETCLGAAIAADDATLVEDIVKHGANPNEADAHGTTPLHCAYRSKSVTTVLLDHGALPNVMTQGSESPLDLAILEPDSGVAELLLARGARMTFAAACKLGKVDFVKKEIGLHPQRVDEVVPGRGRPVAIAAESGQVEVVRALLDAGATLNFDGDRGDAPLYAAAEGGYVEIARLMLDHGANLQASYYQGTALHRAAMYGKLEMVKFLVERGLSVSDPSERGGWTPLVAVASWSDSPEVAEYLISQGADVNQPGWVAGGTALHTAAAEGKPKVAAVLLAHGADTTLRDQRGKTPLDWAVWQSGFEDDEEKQGKAPVAEMLRDR